ncbi:MAG: divergent polysaccharide deacetylase family protein [Alphaproteobacteria bacterium]|nr:divergent polysaccharide deacetylase family protein [Alphaproteobacteria bacterium]
MSLTWIPALTAKVVGALDRRRLPRTIGATAAGLVLASIIVVSLIGSGDDAEPKQIIKIAHAQPAGLGGPMADAPSAVAAPAAALINPAADPALIEATSAGPLPRIGADGRKPMAVYARAYDLAADPRPKVAIVVGGLGFGKALTDAVLERLPPEVTLAVAPQAPGLVADMAAARARGHEVLLEIPMEPHDYPTTDPGFHTLTRDADAKNALRLKWLMSRATGYAGLINTFGDAFLEGKDEAAFVMAETAQRGLFFVEAGAGEKSYARTAAGTAGAPFARADSVIDKAPSREAIDAALSTLEATAKKRGIAIGVAGALPNTIDRVATWVAGLEEKGIALVPVSALAGTAPAAEPLPVASAQPKPRVQPKPRLTSRTRVQARATPPKPVNKRRTTTLKPATPAPAPERPPAQELPSGGEPAAPHP